MDTDNRIPTFETERLVLSPVTLEDVADIEKYFVDWDVIRYLSTQVPWPYPKGEAERFVRDNVVPFQGQDKWVWGLRLKPNRSELIGVVDLWRDGCPEHRGFWLGRPFWGRGLMTEAVQPIMDYAFDELGFETLIFSNACGNIASHRIKLKTGASFLNVAPGDFVDPALTQRELWELSKAAWKRHRASAPDSAFRIHVPETIEPTAVSDLYNAVGWSTYTRDPNRLTAALSGSDLVVTAWAGDALIGLARVLSDDVSIAYVQDLLVHPNHQRKGVGRALLHAVLQRYAHVRQKVLLTDDRPEQLRFYESLGFTNTRALNTTPLNAFVIIEGAK